MASSAPGKTRTPAPEPARTVSSSGPVWLWSVIAKTLRPTSIARRTMLTGVMLASTTSDDEFVWT